LAFGPGQKALHLVVLPARDVLEQSEGGDSPPLEWMAIGGCEACAVTRRWRWTRAEAEPRLQAALSKPASSKQVSVFEASDTLPYCRPKKPRSEPARRPEK
jgi:hypothetical protein